MYFATQIVKEVEEGSDMNEKQKWIFFSIDFSDSGREKEKGKEKGREGGERERKKHGCERETLSCNQGA